MRQLWIYCYIESYRETCLELSQKVPLQLLRREVPKHCANDCPLRAMCLRKRNLKYFHYQISLIIRAQPQRLSSSRCLIEANSPWAAAQALHCLPYRRGSSTRLRVSPCPLRRSTSIPRLFSTLLPCVNHPQCLHTAS